jgi:uncharacterized coiled-coil protein SlyX
MIKSAPRNAIASVMPIAVQPIAITAAALSLILFGIGSTALYRAYSGNSPEQERIIASRQLQARTAQISEQLVEKTNGLEATQQESIDQLQVVQDQLQGVRRLLASQQAETKKLSEQLAALTEEVEGLRQSFASARASETSAEPERDRSRPHAVRTSHRKRGKSRG